MKKGVLASMEANKGHLVLIDSLYDKLVSLYINSPHFNWLIDPSDAYFSNYIELAEIDYFALPDPDVVVMFSVTQADWSSMVSSRGRDLDTTSDITMNYGMQAEMKNALLAYGRRKPNLRIVNFDNGLSHATKAGDRLAQLLALELDLSI